jgi:hypothetical protein
MWYTTYNAKKYGPYLYPCSNIVQIVKHTVYLPYNKSIIENRDKKYKIYTKYTKYTTNILQIYCKYTANTLQKYVNPFIRGK